MIVLDTDHISVLQHESLDAAELRRRGRRRCGHHHHLQEQMRSWLSRIGQTRNVRGQVSFYERLAQMDFFGQWNLLPFTDAAAEISLSLRHRKLPISTMDLKEDCFHRVAGRGHSAFAQPLGL